MLILLIMYNYYMYFLKSELYMLLQERVVVPDGGTPHLQDTTVVNNHINRNLKSLRFQLGDYTPVSCET